MTDFRKGDKIIIECRGRTTPGTVIIASPNSVSLMLGFEAILDRHVGMMPVSLIDGVYRSIVTNVTVTLRKRD